MIRERRFEISEVNKMIDDIISIQEKWDGLNENTKDRINDEFWEKDRPQNLITRLDIVLHDCLEILEEEENEH